jgi:hypothetical protein
MASAEPEEPEEPEESESSSIRWIEWDETRAPSEGATVKTIPLYPRPNLYLPYNDNVGVDTDIPQFRTMYKDILSGDRLYATCVVSPDLSKLMETATVMHLDEFEDLSNETTGEVMCGGAHTAVGRVRLLKVLEPADEETGYYLAEVEDVDDTDSDVDTSTEELEMKELLLSVTELQANSTRSTGSIAISGETVEGFSFDRSTFTFDRKKKGLWAAISLWEAFLWKRLELEQDKLGEQLVEKEQDLLKAMESGSITEEEAQQKMEEEYIKLNADFIGSTENSAQDPQGDKMKEMFQSTSHAERLSLLKELFDDEFNYYRAIASLKSVFR